MKFIQTVLQGAYIVELERLQDERGFFARTFCADEFAAHGLKTHFVQCNLSFNAKKGTLRGLHYQDEPHEEAKLVRCARGAIFDVIVDIRRQSHTYKQWIGTELTDANQRMLYVPEGFAHGFQSLTDGSEVFYQMAASYHPELSRGLRWNDPAFAIQWPIPHPVISDRDATYRDFVR